MIIIGENIHLFSKTVSEAIAERKKEPLQNLAIRQAEGGADYIDLNIGPARKDPEVMKWLVETIQETVDLSLSLDTTNPVAMEFGLSVCKKKPLINSASGKQESKEKMLPLAKKYNCEVIVSVINDSGIPPDVSSRADSIMETVAYANELGIPNEDILIDPVLFPIGVDQNQVAEFLEFIKIIPDICPGCKSAVGLSNLINGVPKELKKILTEVYLVMAERSGLYSAIADALDPVLMKFAKGELTELKELIYKTMDGEVDLVSLSDKEEKDIVKTVDVLVGRRLYSDSYLEIQ